MTRAFKIKDDLKMIFTPWCSQFSLYILQNKNVKHLKGCQFLLI